MTDKYDLSVLDRQQTYTHISTQGHGHAESVCFTLQRLSHTLKLVPLITKTLNEGDCKKGKEHLQIIFVAEQVNCKPGCLHILSESFTVQTGVLCQSNFAKCICKSRNYDLLKNIHITSHIK